MTKFDCRNWTAVIVGIVAGSFVSRSLGEDTRFTAAFRDGARVSSSDVKGWQDSKQTPTLGGRKIFDDNNPCRWMINHSLSPSATPDAFVEFFGGDRLPGDVVGFQSGRDSPYLSLPEHLVIAPAIKLQSPRIARNLQVRVETRWLKRVVWQKRTPDLYKPGHVFLRDGRQLAFRSLRWGESWVTLLLDEGIERVFFNDLMEIHFPLPDVWGALYEQLAVLSPGSVQANSPPARIVQMETANGLKVTTSTERMQPFVHGNKNKSESWYHLCQPAWSLDPLWVEFDTVWNRRFFWAHEIPLTLVEPVRVTQKSPLGESWYWQADRNVYRQTLQSGGKEFGWGFGVHAFHELAFPLPGVVVAARVQAGLDQSVGEGGCVRCRVSFKGNEEKALYESGIVRGTKKILDSGRIAIPALGKGQLLLTVDPLLTEAPSGADPLDIRDSLNWLEPELYLEPEELRKKLAEASTSPLSALDGWTLETDPGQTVVLANSWNEYDREDPRYRVLLGSPGPFLSLTKTMDVGAEDRWLVLAAHRPHDKAPSAVVQIQIDGVALAELDVPPARDALGPDPLLIPIESYRGKTVEVRLNQFSKTQSNPAKASEIGFVDWTGITTSPHRPGLLPLLVESEEFLEQFREGEGGISLDRETKFSSDASVKVTPPERNQASLSNLNAAIRALPQLGEYRLISFAWKKQGGHEIALGLGHHGKLGGEGFGKGRPRIRRDPAKIQRAKVRARKELESVGRGLPYGYRYLRGRSNPDVGSAMMLDRKIPEDWQRVERDLFTDFGEFTLTGLSLTAFDGEAAWFDEVYLARSHRDLHFLPSRIPETKPPNDPNLLALTSSRQQMGQVAGSVLGPFAVAEFGDRVLRFKEYQGKTNVIRTRPRDQKTPAVLRAALQLPKSKNSRLELEVHRHQQGDWKLVVQANGEKIHEAMIDKNRAGETWHQASIDLSRFAGQAVLLEIHNAANNWQNEEAYWGRVEIVADP